MKPVAPVVARRADDVRAISSCAAGRTTQLEPFAELERSTKPAKPASIFPFHAKAAKDVGMPTTACRMSTLEPTGYQPRRRSRLTI